MITNDNKLRDFEEGTIAKTSLDVHLNENKTQKVKLEAREESLIFRQV